MTEKDVRSVLVRWSHYMYTARDGVARRVKVRWEPLSPGNTRRRRRRRNRCPSGVHAAAALRDSFLFFFSFQSPTEPGIAINCSFFFHRRLQIENATVKI